MTVVLANATLAALVPPRLERAHLGVSDGAIAWIGRDLPSGASNVVDCTGRLIMPGNVCAHTHLYSALARGMPAPRRNPRNFPEILELVWWRLDRALDERAVRYSALVGALDAARAGTTTLIDHHASPSFIDGSLDILSDALQEVGLRAVVCYEVTDRNGKDGREAGLRENTRFLRQNQRPTVRGMVGAHASFTLEDDSLDALAQVAADFDTAVHIHVAEDLADEEDSIRRCGQRAALRLADHGVLPPDSIAAHGVYLDSSELSVIHESGCWLVHNCRSNMNNSVGRAPLGEFGARAALGTDGIDGDMFAESRTAYFRGREESLGAFAEQYTEMLARGADLASRFFVQSVGKLEVGSAADLIILRYDPPTLLTAENLPWHWMFALSAEQVESVMVAGEWVIRDRRFCTLDEEKIRAEAREEARRVWHRMDAL